MHVLYEVIPRYFQCPAGPAQFLQYYWLSSLSCTRIPRAADHALYNQFAFFLFLFREPSPGRELRSASCLPSPLYTGAGPSLARVPDRGILRSPRLTCLQAAGAASPARHGGGGAGPCVRMLALLTLTPSDLVSEWLGFSQP